MAFSYLFYLLFTLLICVNCDSVEFSDAFLKLHGANGSISSAQLDQFLESISYNNSDYVKLVAERLHSLNGSCSTCNTQCLSASEFFLRAGAPGATHMNATQISNVLPELFYRIQNPQCYTAAPERKTHRKPTVAESWGFGFLSVTIINLCALLGICFFPFMKRRIYKFIIIFMIALAVGTLLASSLLFLIPEALELANIVELHSEFDGYIYKVSVVCAGVYMFFLVERFLKVMTGLKMKRKRLRHGHSHGGVKFGFGHSHTPAGEVVLDHGHSHIHMHETIPEEPYPSCSMNLVREPKIDPELKIPTQIRPPCVISRDTEDEDKSSAARLLWNTNSGDRGACCKFGGSKSATFTSESTAQLATNNSTVDMEQVGKRIAGADTRTPDGDNKVTPDVDTSVVGHQSHSHIAPIAWMLLFGDTFHNFIDGLSIGAAFATSVTAGISISISVLCEELPHELGDFAVMLNSGMTMKFALACNAASACVCYLGLVVGILLGEMTGASTWVFSIAAGMFLYISLVDMMPEVNQMMEGEEAEELGRGKIFLLQNVGLITGFSLLLVLALYGDVISNITV